MTIANTSTLDPKEGTKLKPQNTFSPKPKTAFEIKEEEELAFLQELDLKLKKEQLSIVSVVFTFGHPDGKENQDDEDDNLYKVTHYGDGTRLVENVGLSFTNDENKKEDENIDDSNKKKEKAGFVAVPLILQEGFDIKERIKALNNKLNDFFGKKSAGEVISQEEVQDIKKEINAVKKFKN